MIPLSLTADGTKQPTEGPTTEEHFARAHVCAHVYGKASFTIQQLSILIRIVFALTNRAEDSQSWHPLRYGNTGNTSGGGEAYFFTYTRATRARVNVVESVCNFLPTLDRLSGGRCPCRPNRRIDNDITIFTVCASVTSKSLPHVVMLIPSSTLW